MITNIKYLTQCIKHTEARQDRDSKGAWGRGADWLDEKTNRWWEVPVANEFRAITLIWGSHKTKSVP